MNVMFKKMSKFFFVMFDLTTSTSKGSRIPNDLRVHLIKLYISLTSLSTAFKEGERNGLSNEVRCALFNHISRYCKAKSQKNV